MGNYLLNEASSITRVPFSKKAQCDHFCPELLQSASTLFGKVNNICVLQLKTVNKYNLIYHVKW